MKMTYDDFEPGKYYKHSSLGHCKVLKGDNRVVFDWYNNTLTWAGIGYAEEKNWLGECDRDGNLLKQEPACSECERLASELNHIQQEHDYLERQVKELEAKLSKKENQRSQMQSQRDHMSAKLAELTGMTPKEVRDGVKLLVLGLKDKRAVKPDPEMVEFEGIPGKWFPHTPGEPLPIDGFYQSVTEEELEESTCWSSSIHIFNRSDNWDDLIAYRPADREDMR